MPSTDGAPARPAAGGADIDDLDVMLNSEDEKELAPAAAAAVAPVAAAAMGAAAGTDMDYLPIAMLSGDILYVPIYKPTQHDF